jgi:serine/threonine protein kinase
VARGLAYLHDKKWVHGNVKPSNILLDADMEPLLADLGVDRLVRGADGGHKPSSSSLAGRFGSKRSAKSLPDLSPPPSSHAGGPPASPLAGAPAADTAAHYRAPEAARSPKASAKWDVFSFGVLLLELVAGRALTSVELCQCAADENAQALRVADPALRGEVEGREEAVASCLRLGAACCAMAPGKRPSIKDALLAIERIPALAAASSSSCSTAAHQ